MSGTNSAAPIKPTATYDPVISFTWYGRATYVIIDPRPETRPDENKRRKSRTLLSKERSKPIPRILRNLGSRDLVLLIP